MNKNIEILQAVIGAIKKRSEMEGRPITLDDIMLKADITKEHLQALLSGEEEIPEDFITNLNNLYGFKMVTVSSLEFENINLDECDEDEIEDEIK